MTMPANMVTSTKKLQNPLKSSQSKENERLQEMRNDKTIGANNLFDFTTDNFQNFTPYYYNNNVSVEEGNLNWKEFERELLHPFDNNEISPYTEGILPVQPYSSLFFPYDAKELSSPVLSNLFTEPEIMSDSFVVGQSPTLCYTYGTPPASPFSVEPVTFDNGFSLFLKNDDQDYNLENLYALKEDTSSCVDSGWRFIIEEQKSPKQQPSQLLERCRSGNVGGLDLDNIRAHIYTFATDQFGSRFIQQMYDSASKEKKAAAFNCLLPHIFNLSSDPFGNYIVQKLFASGDELQRSQMLEVLHGQILKLSLDPFGCRVMQKALEVGKSAEAAYIANEIKDDIVRCMMDQHGNHVAQRIIIGISFDYYETILMRIDKNKNELSYVDLSLHQYACRVIQSIIKTMPSYLRFTMTEELYRHIDCLLSHEYGNYVAQKMFNHGISIERYQILRCFCGDLLRYSCNKYASNVIEFCLKNGTRMERKFLIEKVFDESSENLLRLMISDQYGNYVIQQMIGSAEDTLKRRLIFSVKSMQSQLRNHSFYKNVFNKCAASQK